MLTQKQKLDFYENGYIKVAGVVPKLMVDSARKLINHSIGSVGMHQADLEKFRAQSYCNEIKNAPQIVDIFSKTPIHNIAESMLGEGNVQIPGSAQIALRFPMPLERDPNLPRGHLDGLGSGTNGMEKGVYRRGFTALAVVYLADVPEPFSGNFTVWPKSHSFFADYFKKEGHEILANGMPRPDLPEGPTQIVGKAGDVVLTHHQIVHSAAPNASADVRYAVIFRLRHVDCIENGYDGYTDIWREWPGIQEAAAADAS
ncbi:phytanoyl-CoA dioxygenase family protein [Candidatus Poribacteria bacterium]|nr:phytanoyl-CoA dioxygenase family protein [Candidatus Poribacteria bacterium]